METMQKLCPSTKFSHQEISWYYGILRSNKNGASGVHCLKHLRMQNFIMSVYSSITAQKPEISSGFLVQKLCGKS